MEESNFLSETLIRKIYENAFSKSGENIKIKSLTGGVESKVYLIEDNGFKTVLKLEPLNILKSISVDKNTFWWEIKMLKLMEKINFPSPKILFYDNSKKICNFSYFFMTYIEGVNYLENKDNISLEERKQIEYQLGLLSKKISSIKSQKYFIPSNPKYHFKNNYEFVVYLFKMLMNDGRNNALDITEDTYNYILKILKEHENSLNNVNNICLCHTDIWDGNVIVNNGNVSGIVDFSDLYFCDELMTFYFHTIDGITSEDFLKGYGKEKLNYDEKIRIEIYRMYIIFKMIVECKIKNYGRYDWMYDNFTSKLNKLKR